LAQGALARQPTCWHEHAIPWASCDGQDIASEFVCKGCHPLRVQLRNCITDLIHRGFLCYTTTDLGTGSVKGFNPQEDQASEPALCPTQRADPQKIETNEGLANSHPP
jgi:hypothetical protein